MSVCCVCKKRRITGSSIVFHSFPRDDKLALQWCQILGLNRHPLPSTKVCAEHFTDEDYDSFDGSTKIKNLLVGAIPSRNLPASDSGKRKADTSADTFELSVPENTRNLLELPSYLLDIESILNRKANPNSIEYRHDPELQTITINYQLKPESSLSTEHLATVCSRCQAVFKKNSDLVLHQKICLDKLKPYQCASCLASYESVGELRDHKCNLGDSQANRAVSVGKQKLSFREKLQNINRQDEIGCKMNLEKRQQIEVLSRNITGQKYDSESDGIDDSDVASSNKKCLECNRFIPVANMQRHYQKLHEGKDLPFPCRLCRWKFATCVELCKHLKSHPVEALIKLHEESQEGLVYRNGTRENFECHLCGDVFGARQILQSHQRTHLKVDFRCPICSWVIAEKTDFVKHLKGKHFVAH